MNKKISEIEEGFFKFIQYFSIIRLITTLSRSKC